MDRGKWEKIALFFSQEIGLVIILEIDMQISLENPFISLKKI